MGCKVLHRQLHGSGACFWPGAKQVSLVLLAFTGGFLLCTLPFCLPDPVYAPADYLWAAKGIFPALFLLLSYGGILAGVRRWKRRETR